MQVTSKGSDQTARMRRLIYGFAGRTYYTVGNLMSRLNCKCFKIKEKANHDIHAIFEFFNGYISGLSLPNGINYSFANVDLKSASSV